VFLCAALLAQVPGAFFLALFCFVSVLMSKIPVLRTRRSQTVEPRAAPLHVESEVRGCAVLGVRRRRRVHLYVLGLATLLWEVKWRCDGGGLFSVSSYGFYLCHCGR
jgi:hypothetical protein